MRFDSVNIAIASLVLAISFPAFAAELSGRVVAVKDGDSIVILDEAYTEYQVRLGGIDAPERSQPYGQAAKKALATMIYGKTVKIIWSERDQYQRIVGKVLWQDTDINLRQIQSGYAWHYRQYQTEQDPVDRERYIQAEIAARGSGIGLWQQTDPVPPWRYRRIQRNR